MIFILIKTMLVTDTLDISIIHVHFKQKIKDSEVSFCIYLKFIQFSQEVKIYLILKRIYFFGISEMTL